MFERVSEILEENAYDPKCFQLQFVAYRSYDSTSPDILLQRSGWSSDATKLRHFLTGVRARGGIHDKAVEVALQYINECVAKDVTNGEVKISSVLLIGDAPPTPTKDTIMFSDFGLNISWNTANMIGLGEGEYNDARTTLGNRGALSGIYINDFYGDLAGNTNKTYQIQACMSHNNVATGNDTILDISGSTTVYTVAKDGGGSSTDVCLGDSNIGTMSSDSSSDKAVLISDQDIGIYSSSNSFNGEECLNVL